MSTAPFTQGRVCAPTALPGAQRVEVLSRMEQAEDPEVQHLQEAKLWNTQILLTRR
jgi:hypothetical protein